MPDLQRFQGFQGFQRLLRYAGFGLALIWLATPSAQEPVTAIRAGRLFDAKAGTMLTNQVVLIRGDRIAEVGATVAVPAGARIIDLSAATVLPGMIDAHVHVALNVANESVEHHTFVMIQSAQRDLDAGFTTIVDMDSRGGFGTVELRNAINSGLVRGPRMQVAGQSLNPRAIGADTEHRAGPLQRLHRRQEHQRPVARARGRPRAEAPRHRLGEDLHDAGFRGRRTARVPTRRFPRGHPLSYAGRN